MTKLSPLFRIVVGIGLVALALFSLAQVAAASTPTADILGKYDGPTVEVPLFTMDGSDHMGIEIIKLPDATKDGLIPYVCFRTKGQQKMSCVVMNVRGGYAYAIDLYLKRLET